MSHTLMPNATDLPEPDDRRHWREFTDHDAHQDRLTHELAGTDRALAGCEEW